MQLLTLLSIFCAFLFGLFCAHHAKKRGRSPLVWSAIGFLFGIFGVITLFILPKVKQEEAQKPAPSISPPQPKRSEAWMKMWYYLDPAHKPQGPFEFSDLIKAWKAQGLSERSYIWGEGMAEWKRLTELPDLRSELDQA